MTQILITQSVTCKTRFAHTGIATLFPLTSALVSTGTWITQIDLGVTQIMLSAPCKNTGVQSILRTSSAVLVVLLWSLVKILLHSLTRHTFKSFRKSTTFSWFKKLLVDTKPVHERKSKSFKFYGHTHTHTHKQYRREVTNTCNMYFGICKAESTETIQIVICYLLGDSLASVV
jgi:hypothetical protein